MKTRKTVTSKLLRNLLVVSLPVAALSGCYVVPVGQDASGRPYYTYSPQPVPPVVVQRNSYESAQPMVVPGAAMPVTLFVKLYPMNDLANQTGVLTGEVTNMLNGHGRFSFNYQGETLVGEATRVSNDERRGLASAYGARGTSARCDYQMSTARMGAGTCSFSNGAQYQLHVGG
jgi:hypothetical protein